MALVTTTLAIVVIPERSVEVAYVAAALGSAWLLYLLVCWRSRRSLLATTSVLVGTAAFIVCGENILTLQRLTSIQLVTSLQLGPRLAARVRQDPRVRTRSWQPFGPDPLFYRLAPRSEYRERADYRKSGPEYVTAADDVGFLNGESSYYTGHGTIDVFLAGDSVLQGVGIPGVVERLRSRLASTIYNLSTGGYGPREKVDALLQFAPAKRPRTMLLEFFAGNDATDSIEDDACAALHLDYRCRFDTMSTARALSADPAYAGFSAYGEFGRTIDFLRGVRSSFFSLAIATRLSEQIRHAGTAAAAPMTGPHLNGELMTLPGFTHYRTPEPLRIEWVRRGLALTLAEYDRLRSATIGTNAEVIVVYNPTSYEIYRELLATADVDRTADDIAQLQSTTLFAYAKAKGWGYCDLTGSFRGAVRGGARGFFSAHDGTHWSAPGTEAGATALEECLTQTSNDEPE